MKDRIRQFPVVGLAIVAMLVTLNAPAQMTLGIARSGNHAVFSWPVAASNGVLQSELRTHYQNGLFFFTGFLFNGQAIFGAGPQCPLMEVRFVLQNIGGSDDNISVNFGNFSLTSPSIPMAHNVSSSGVSHEQPTPATIPSNRQIIKSR